MRKGYEGCPAFDHFDYEPILKWAAEHHNATIEWDDTTVSGRGVVVKHDPRMAWWSLSWDAGFIGFDHIPENTHEAETKARKTAALFIYFWSLGCDPGLADKAASAYVENVSMDRFHIDEDRPWSPDSGHAG